MYFVNVNFFSALTAMLLLDSHLDLIRLTDNCFFCPDTFIHLENPYLSVNFLRL